MTRKHFDRAVLLWVLSLLLLSGCQDPAPTMTAAIAVATERPGATATERPLATATDQPAATATEPPGATATDQPTAAPSPTRSIVAPPAPGGPVTLNTYQTVDIPTLDPQQAEDGVSIDHIENLFINLTNQDLLTGEALPEAATSWTISPDGLVYTFNIRQDIPWVWHHPLTGETSQAVDDVGSPRFVSAHDFAYAIKRLCDPNIEGYYSSVIAPVIKGCNEVRLATEPDNFPVDLAAAIGVNANADGTQLTVELVEPASYFISMTSMWSLAATPAWVIEAHGDAWIEAGTIVTSGRYALHEWVHSVRNQLWRNPFMPQDMAGSGNIAQVITYVVPDAATGYALWLNNDVGIADIPDAEVETHLTQFPNETDAIPDLAVFYMGFRVTKPPFDDVHVRRAFSAAIDREGFVAEVRQGQGLPMRHLAPPGIFGAPPLDEVGVGYNVAYAQAELAAAGYPNCEGFPRISIARYGGQSTLDWVAFVKANWVENLGCDPSSLFSDGEYWGLLEAISSEQDSNAPHMWTLGWGPNYDDENNWVGDVLHCESNNYFHRPCNHIDDLIEEARRETDPAQRVALYRQIEEAFFGEEGEFPMIPIFARTNFQARHDWLTRAPVLFGGQRWYDWTIDVAAQMAASGD